MTALCKEAIDFFKKHEKWRYQFLPAFEFTKSKGLESYDKLFGPKLIEHIEKFLEEDDCIPTIDSGWAEPKQVVRLTEDQRDSEDLITMGILNKDEIAPFMGGQPNLKLVHPDVIDRDSNPIRKVSRWEILENDNFLKGKTQALDSANWYRALYKWLLKHPVYEDYYPYRARYARKRVIGYHKYEFILTTDKRLLKGGEVSLLDIPSEDPIIKDLADTLQTAKPMLHPDILAVIKDEEEQKALRGFLTGLTGVQILDSKAVCKDALLPKILTNAPKPSPEDLLRYTSYCQQILGDEIGEALEFRVLTKQGDVRAAKEVLFPKEFKPEQDWETHQQYVSGISFISPRYVEGITTDDQ